MLDAHGSTPRTLGRKGFKWLLKWLFDAFFGYRVLRDASKVIAQTELGISEYKAVGVKSHDRIVLITPLRDVGEFSNLPQPGNFSREFDLQGKRIIMFLGRIHWLKGIDFLVESFCELASCRKDVVLAIVGQDDGHKHTLEKLVDSLDLSDRVLFTGFRSGREKLSALVDADVLVQTSIYEQGAWAPYEAVLCNTPIIVSSNSGAGEDVRRMNTGYLVEYGNRYELRDMIQYVLNHPAEAAEKTQRAKEYITTNLSLESGVERYEMLYAELTEHRSKDRLKMTSICCGVRDDQE